MDSGPLKTLFDNMNAKSKKDDLMDVDIPDFDDDLADKPKGSKKGNSNKRLSVERIYQKKTQLEHILLRPDTYIGSVEKLTQNMWVWDDIEECFNQRELTFVPGLYKIFDEILVNASDNKQRDSTMTTIKIDIDPENNKIKIWNNGKGIPVVEHKEEKVFVPTLIFGTLLTSSNYNDEEKKVTGGRNGYGAKLCNIFSKKFIVETSAKEYKKQFKQEWSDNMTKTTNAKIKESKDDDYTCVTFYPDLDKFKMDVLDRDIVDLFTRRAYDIAAGGRGIKVFLNGKRLPIKGFKDYVDLYVKGKTDDQNQPLKVTYENVNDRWEVAVTLSDKGFQQVSFVNSIATTKGGRHVDYVADQLVTKLIEVVKKKQKKGDSINIKPFQVKGHMWVFVNAMIENPAFDSQTKETLTTTAKHFGSKCSLTDKFVTQVKGHMWVFVNCLVENPAFDSQTKEALTTTSKHFGSKCQMSEKFVNQVKSHMWVFVNAAIENPTFDSQTKENMTLQQKSFGSKCSLPEKFIIQANKVGIVESIMSWMKFKAQEKMNKKCGNVKQSKLKGIPKLDDANDAGTRNSSDCTLILTEGDSAKTLAVAGLSVVGRDKYGIFPLKGKVLNVREAAQKQIMENAEINNIIKILGLRYKEKYESPESMKTLRYGKIMIMTDQDQDGSHIKGLLVNFVHHNWPGLLRQRFLEEFITPIVKVTKSKAEHSFYSLPEFEEWKKETENWHTWRVKYYKGLGTSTAKEAKEYFSDMERHRIPFKYTGTEDDAAINLAFSKKKIEERKEWLTNWMEERKRRAQLDLPEIFLYGKETKYVTYNEFINRELILFSNMDNERSIPSLVDGFKPGQRKVMYTCFKRNILKDFKVAQLAGSVAEHSAYHHGEASLMGTIINLAQNYVGSNNANLLLPIGQFGTRLHGGKDSASPRYIFTALSSIARLLFPQTDEPLLKYNFDDNQKIEPEYYVPILPMVLVNGAEGIGTGWSTKINNYDPREIVLNLKKMIDGEDPTAMHPWYKNFNGTIQPVEDSRYVSNGEISIVDDTTVEITELPIRTWTQSYKENVMEPMLQGSEKVPPSITDYKEYHTDITVKFVVKMTPEKLAKAEAEGLHKFFKIQSSMSTGSMVLFDSNGCIKRYHNVMEILQEFFELRLDFYQRRKDYMEGMLAAESLKLDNQARFIMEKVEGTITIENKPKKELIQMLVRRGYDSDPVKTWKDAQSKLETLTNDSDDEDSEVSSARESGPDFNYILGMALWCLTKEKVDEICKNRDAKAEELYLLKKKTPSDLWRFDLNAFLEELNKLEEQERKDDAEGIKIPAKSSKGRKTFKKIAVEQTRPSPIGRRVEPKIDIAIKKAALQATKKNAKAKLKANNSSGDLQDMFAGAMDEDSNEPKSLMDRIGGLDKLENGDAKDVKVKDVTNAKVKDVNEAMPKKEKKPRAPRAKKDSSESPKKKVSPKKKGKKKNPWSEESEGSMSNSGSDVDNVNASFDDVVIPRDTGARRAAAKQVKYAFDEDESDEGFEAEGVAAGNVDTVTRPVVSDDDEEDEEDSYKPADLSDGSDFDFGPSKTTSPPPSTTTAASKAVFGDSDDEDEEEAAPKPAASTVYRIDSDSEDSDAPIFPPAAEPTVKPLIIKKPVEQPKKSKKTLGSKKHTDPKQPGIASALGGTQSKAKAQTKSKPSTKTSKKATNTKSKPVVIDSDEDDFMEIESVESFPATASQKFSSQSTDGEEKPKKKAAPKRKKKSSDLSDFSEDDFNPKPKKAAAKKSPKKATFMDSDSENEVMPVKKTKAPAKKSKKSADSSDDEFNAGGDDDFNVAEVAPRATTGRARAKAAKYTFDDDEDDDDDF